MNVEIKNRWSGDIIFSFKVPDGTQLALRCAVEVAVKSRADLAYANLARANLADANLAGADLAYANLAYANLARANLARADLAGADLAYADLAYANLADADLARASLAYANLAYANLARANLARADLARADLAYADLAYANLADADLARANLAGADLAPLEVARLSICPENGAFEGWKKCRDGVLVRLQIPSDARRSNAAGRKCRAERALVLEVVGGDGKRAVSAHESALVYELGAVVEADRWEENRWIECAGGIHFYLRRAEAEAWS